MSFMREGRDQLLNNYFKTRAKNKQPHMISSYPFWGKNGIKGFWKDFSREYKKQAISQKSSSYIMYSLCTLFFLPSFTFIYYRNNNSYRDPIWSRLKFWLSNYCVALGNLCSFTFHFPHLQMRGKICTGFVRVRLYNTCERQDAGQHLVSSLLRVQCYNTFERSYVGQHIVSYL